MKHTQLFILVLFLSLQSLRAGVPGGLQWYFFSPRQMAMGYTGISNWNDVSTASMNPGAIVFSRQSGVQIGTSMVRPATTFLEAAPSVYLDTTIIPTQTPLFLNSVFHINTDAEKRRISIGLAVNQPFGVSVTWPDQWKGKFITQEFSLNTYFLHLTTSIKLNEKIGIGIGGSYGAFNLISRRALKDTDGITLDVGSATLTGTDLTWGIFFGLFVKMSETSRFSVSLRSPMAIQIDNGAANFSVPVSLENQYPNQQFSTRFWLPPQLDLGFQFNATSRLRVNIAANYTGWQLLDSLSYELETPVPSLSQYPETGFRNSLAMRIGGELSITENLALRGGSYLENTAIPTNRLSPQFPDASRIGFTSGLGYRYRRITVDAAYQFSFTGERSGILEPASFGGIYESNAHAVSLGLGYLW